MKKKKSPKPSTTSGEKPAEVTPENIETPDTNTGGEQNPPDIDSKEALKEAIKNITKETIKEIFQKYYATDNASQSAEQSSFSRGLHDIADQINGPTKKDVQDKQQKEAKERAEAKTDQDGTPQITPYSRKIDQALDIFIKSIKKK